MRAARRGPVSAYSPVRMNFNPKVIVDRSAGPVSLVPVLLHVVGAPRTVVLVDCRNVDIELRRNPDAAQ